MTWIAAFWSDGLVWKLFICQILLQRRIRLGRRDEEVSFSKLKRAVGNVDCDLGVVREMGKLYSNFVWVLDELEIFGTRYITLCNNAIKLLMF